MNKFDKYKKGIITIEIQSHIPEKFINLLWKNEIQIKNIRKKSITTMTMDINLKDYNRIEEIAKRTKTKIKILNRRGLTFFLIKVRKRTALVFGSLLFVFILYYLSTFIWRIDIQTENNLSPYEIRQQLMSYGIVPGISKNKINVYELQDKMLKSNNDSIMYFRARIEGSRLIVNAIEKTPPPNMITETEPCNLVAKKDAEIVRVFTAAGTATVKKGDMVKAGQIIVKGEQGKDGSTYAVHAKGSVYARTFYEEIKEVPLKGIKKEKTGNKIENIYVEIMGKRIYLKNSLNKFKTYDKIIENSSFIKKEIYEETKEINYSLDVDAVTKSTSDELFSKIIESLDKTVKIQDKNIYTESSGDNLRVRVLIIAEENIAIEEKLQ